MSPFFYLLLCVSTCWPDVPDTIKGNIRDVYLFGKLKRYGTYFEELFFIINSYTLLRISYRVKDKEQALPLTIFDFRFTIDFS